MADDVVENDVLQLEPSVVELVPVRVIVYGSAPRLSAYGASGFAIDVSISSTVSFMVSLSLNPIDTIACEQCDVEYVDQVFAYLNQRRILWNHPCNSRTCALASHRA